jgi:GT2 family glycosyltransferase
MNDDPAVGILAFRSVNFHTGEIEKWAFPWKNKKRPNQEEFETTWFIGVGHAFRKEVYDKVGLYRDYFPYGHEELDLSLRVVDAGYKIVYFPKAEIYHKKSPTSRISNPTRFFANQLTNRVIVAIRNLPWRYVLTTNILRSGQTLLRSRFNLIAVLWAQIRIVKKLPGLLREREVISKEAIRKIKALRGPVVF